MGPHLSPAHLCSCEAERGRRAPSRGEHGLGLPVWRWRSHSSAQPLPSQILSANQALPGPDALGVPQPSGELAPLCCCSFPVPRSCHVPTG